MLSMFAFRVFPKETTSERAPLMGWVRISDDFYDHPKFVDLSLASVGLWANLLAWSNRNRRDGNIPDPVARRMGATEDVLRELLAVDLLELDPDSTGFVIHDYHDFQPSADEIAAKRAEIAEKRAEAGRKGAASRWEPDSNGDGKPMASGEANVCPQTQTQLSPNGERTARSKRKPKSSIPVPFRPDDAVLAFAESEYPTVDVHHVAGKLVDWALKGDEQAVDWQRALKVWIRREHERQQQGGWR